MFHHTPPTTRRLVVELALVLSHQYNLAGVGIYPPGGRTWVKPCVSALISHRRWLAALAPRSTTHCRLQHMPWPFPRQWRPPWGLAGLAGVLRRDPICPSTRRSPPAV